MTEHHFSSGVVHLWSEDEAATLGRWHDRPAGECASDVDHVLLGVSAVHSERVQFKQFASVVLIQPLTLALLLLLLWPRHGADPAEYRSDPPTAERSATDARKALRTLESRLGRVSHAARVVEIEEHRRTFRDGFQEIAEFSERVGPDDVLIEVHQVIRLRRALGSVDVEVVLPEIGHHFLQLPLTGDRASNSRRL